MPAIKSPQKVIRHKGHVIVPKEEYDRLSRIDRWKHELDDDLAEAIDEVKRGETYGPFESVDKAIAFLEDREAKKR